MHHIPRGFLIIPVLCLLAILPGCTAKESPDQAKSQEKSTQVVSVGNPAPPFTLQDLSGRTVGLDEYKGKVVMLEFFTSWCLPCQMVAQDIEALYKKLRGKGFVVIGISLKDGFNKDNLRDYIAKYGITYPVLIDDDRISKQYGVITMPTTVIIDKEGVVRARHLGIVRDHAAMLSREIEPLIR